MTSAPVMGSYFSQSMKNIGIPTVRAQDSGANFKSLMEKPAETPGAEPVKPKSNTATNAHEYRTNEKATVKTEASDEKPDVSLEVETKNIDEKTMDTKETIEKVESILSAELNVSKEQIEEALEILGLTVAALLDQDMMPRIVAELTGKDVISITTDEDAFAKLTTVSKVSDEAVNEIADNLEIPAEEIAQAVKQLENKPKETEKLPTEAGEEFKSLLTTPQGEDSKPQKVENFEEKTEIIVEDSAKTEASSDRKPSIRNSENTEIPETKATQTTEKIGKTQRGAEDSQAFSNNSHTMNFAQTIIAKATEAFNETAEAAGVKYSSLEVENILNQLTDSIRANVSAENTEISMRLHPETLGTVSVKISANNEGVLTATFTAQNEAVKAVIESQALVLRESLEAKGTTVEAIEVLVQSHEFERDLSGQNRGQSDTEMGKGKKTRRINLDEDIPENLTEDETLVREMMAQNGNTIDYSA